MGASCGKAGRAFVRRHPAAPPLTDWVVKFVKQAYLDNSATTAVCKQAADKAYEMMTGCYGNPSSLHTVGFAAEQELTAARRAVAKLLGCPPDTLIFTSGGTEANNLAILGGWAARKRRGGHAVTTAVEHPSVAAAFDALEKEGAQVDRLVPDEQGRLTAEQIAAACREGTILVSVMLVNNETGARFPVEEAAPLIRRRAPQALIHCDAVQAAGKIPVFPEKMGVDALSVSGHKLHAPKGVGALYLRKGVRVVPRALGGGQEKGLRSGTEPVPLIAAFGAAAAALPPFEDQRRHYEALRALLLRELGGRDDIRFHLPEGGVPYIVHLSVPGLRSETLLHFLAERGVSVSSGSACSKGRKSPVLTAMGLPSPEIDSALRLSFCYENTEQDIRQFLDALEEAMASLARKGR